MGGSASSGAARGGYRKQPCRTEYVEDEHGKRVHAHAKDQSLRPEDQAREVDAGQEHAESGKVDIRVMGLREDRLTRDQCRDEEEHRQKGVAAEDVADPKLVVSRLGRG